MPRKASHNYGIGGYGIGAPVRRWIKRR